MFVYVENFSFPNNECVTNNEQYIYINISYESSQMRVVLLSKIHDRFLEDTVFVPLIKTTVALVVSLSARSSNTR